MHFPTLLIAALSATLAAADLHNELYCYSRIQPFANNNSCGSKRDVSPNTSHRLEARSYADNYDATKKACAAYRNRNTGTKQWDTCPDCTMVRWPTSDPNYCVWQCSSAGKHLGGDEFHYYCKQAGADGSQ